MHLRILILFALGLVASLTWLGKKLNLPHPALQVCGGVLLGIWPPLLRFQLDPQLTLNLLFPPLLFFAGWFTSWPDFKRNLWPIMTLAIGLVLFTTAAVGAVAHVMVPGFSWPVALLLGALVSPTDPVAATNIAKRSGVSARVVSIVEGESWVNDGTALVLYQIAISAVLTGSLSITHAGLQFTFSLLGGAIAGLVIALITCHLGRLALEAPVRATLYLLAAYTAYFLADRFQASGIVASCVAGLFLAQNQAGTSSEEHSRLSYFFETVSFLLSSSLFVFLGLQLPEAVRRVASQGTINLIVLASIVPAIVIATRLAWIAANTYLTRRGIPREEKKRARHEAAIVGWSGFRGALSVVAGLAIPLSGPRGTVFPHRDLLIFLSFCVVVATLGFQGLSLSYMIRRFRWATNEHSVEKDGTARSSSETSDLPSYRLENTSHI